MRYHLFGFTVETDYRFKTPLVESDAQPDLRFSCTPVAAHRDPGRADLIFRSDYKNKYGESAVQLFRHNDTEIMRFPRIADFIIRPGSIECELLAPRIAYMVEICLLGHVFAYTLERSGISPIHGASLDFDGRAALLIGDSGAGKSTLAASILSSGFPLVADDISALEIRGDAAVCRSGYPQIKLTPEQTEFFVGPAAGYEKVHEDFPKLGIPVSALGSFTATALPVARVYLLERIEAETDSHGCDRSRRQSRDNAAHPGNSEGDEAASTFGEIPSSVQLEPLSQADALKELLRNSFITEIVDASDLRIPRLRRLARIARTLQVQRLRYPAGYARLPEVLQAIRADLD